jgi:hypothetical protein
MSVISVAIGGTTDIRKVWQNVVNDPKRTSKTLSHD